MLHVDRLALVKLFLSALHELFDHVTGASLHLLNIVPLRAIEELTEASQVEAQVLINLVISLLRLNEVVTRQPTLQLHHALRQCEDHGALTLSIRSRQGSLSKVVEKAW